MKQFDEIVNKWKSKNKKDIAAFESQSACMMLWEYMPKEN
jgi:hypothetical protein